MASGSAGDRPLRPIWNVDERALQVFMERMQQPPDSAQWFALRRAAERLALVPGFDSLITLDSNTIKELPHQIDVALRVLRQMGGRAILADEVGLGKTIEAGIVLKELAVRGLARRILILTPAALVDQWCGELETKFFEVFETPTDGDDWRRCSRAIVSYHRAVRKQHQEAILRTPWDLVILDEAHKVKNHLASIHQFVAKIQRNYILLLTATPLQTDLRELSTLVTLLRPGQLGPWRDFSRRYLTSGDRRKVTNPAAVRELTSEVMIRTRRSSVAQSIDLPPRRPTHPVVVLTPSERDLYDRTVLFLRELYASGFYEPTHDEIEEDAVRKRRRGGKGIMTLEIMRLCQRLCSSSAALADSLRKFNEGELITPEYRDRAVALADDAAAIDSNAKLVALRRVLEEHTGQVIVFSEHLPTLALLDRHVRASGRRPILYQGGLSRVERARRLRLFKEATDGVFIATRAGTEVLNLQLCNVLVNYELPWNPMVVEQRIGRIHRIGQTREAHIINFAARGTIEAHILTLLDQKIRLFELVVGELDVILGDFGGAESMAQRITDEFLRAKTEGEFEKAIDSIGDEISRSRKAGLEQERLNADLSGDDNAMRLERDFVNLEIPARVRLGLGTKHLKMVLGLDARRRMLLLPVH